MVVKDSIENQILDIGSAALIDYFFRKGIPLNLEQKSFARVAFGHAVLNGFSKFHKTNHHPDQLTLL